MDVPKTPAKCERVLIVVRVRVLPKVRSPAAVENLRDLWSVKGFPTESRVVPSSQPPSFLVDAILHDDFETKPVEAKKVIKC